MKKLKKVFLYFLSILIISTEISIGLGSVVLAKENSLEIIEEEKTSIDNTIGELYKLRELIESSILKAEILKEENEENNENLSLKLEELENLISEFKSKLNLLEDENLKKENEEYILEKEEYVEELKELIKKNQELEEESDKELKSEIAKLYENLELKITKLEIKTKTEKRSMNLDEKSIDFKKIEIQEDLNLLNEKINILEDDDEKEEWAEKYNGLMKRFNALAEARAVVNSWADVQPLINSGETEIDVSNLPDDAGNIEIEIDGKDVTIIGDVQKIIKGLQINLKNAGKLTIENLNINNSEYPIKEEKSAIRVLDNKENTLTLKGTNTFNNLNIKVTIAVNKNENEYAKLYIQGDGYLNIIGIAEGTDEQIRKIGASIGGDFESSSGDIYLGEDGSSPKLNINLNLGGAGIGSGKDQGLNNNGTISIGGKTKIVSKRTYEEYLTNPVRYSTVGAVIGGGYDELGQRKGSSGTIIIKDDAEIDANIYGFGSAVIGQGLGTTIDKIEIKDNAKIIAINNAEYKNNSFKNINTETEENKTYKKISPEPLNQINNIEDLNNKKIDSKMVENIDEDISKGAGIGLAAADMDAKPAKDAVINIEGNPNIIAFGHGAIALGDGKININGGKFNIGTITGPGIGFMTGIKEFGEEAESETEPAIENDLKIENANIKVYAFVDSREHNWAAGIGSRYNNDASNVNIEIKNSNIYGETEDGALIGSSKTTNSGTASISIVDSTIEGKTKIGSLIGSGGRIASSYDKLKRDLKNNFTIYLKNNQIKGETTEGAVIGTGSYMTYKNLEENPNKYIINIEDSKFDNNIKSIYGALIGTGTASETNMEINIKNSDIDLTNKLAAVIGGGWNTENFKSTAGDIIIDGGKLNLNGIYSSAIGGGFGKEYTNLKRNDKMDGTLKVINDAELLATSLKNWENNGEFNYKEPISARILEDSQFIMNNKSFKIDFKTLNIEDLLIKVYDNKDNYIKEFKLVDNKEFTDNRVVNKAYAYSLPKEYNNSENILTEYMEKDGKIYKIKQAEPLREENRHPKELFEFKTVANHQAATLEDSDLTYVELGENTELPIENLEVIFDANEGKFEDNKDIHQIKVKKGSKLTEEDLKTPIREAYKFIGWTYDKEGKGEIIIFEDILKLEINENKYFYAKWKEVETTEPENPDGGGSGGGNHKPHRPNKPNEKPEEIIRPQIESSLLHKEYINGYPDNTVRPEGNLTREEASAILDRVTENKSMTKRLFNYPDVKNNRWSYNNIENLSNKGGIKGYPDGEFKPVNKITRAEAATILVRLENAKSNNKNIPEEIKNHWAKEEINIAIEKGWIKGYEDGSIKADNFITRAEFVTLVNRMQNRKVKNENILENIKHFNDLEKNAWYYEDIVEAANTHNYKEKRLEDNSEKWTSIIK